MREKGRLRKVRKILIRVNKDEKKDAESQAHKEGKNTSEFFRDLLRDHKETKKLELLSRVIENSEEVLVELRSILKVAKRKIKG